MLEWYLHDHKRSTSEVKISVHAGWEKRGGSSSIPFLLEITGGQGFTALKGVRGLDCCLISSWISPGLGHTW